MHAGEWWKNDIQTVMEDFLRSGGDPAISDALTINGQPGDQYNCSGPGSSFDSHLSLYKVQICD